MSLPFAAFYEDTWFMVVLGLVLVGLIGLLLFFRKKGTDE